MEHEKISCEYMQEKRQRLETLDNTFGTAVLPTLEKVEYRVSWCNEVLNRVPGAQWLSGRVLDSRQRGRRFESHRRHCNVVLEQDTFILA